MPRIFAALVLSIGLCLAIAAAPPAEPGAVLAHVKFLSSDEMKGRASGSPELERAADYVAGQFEKAGLQPGWNGTWSQPFELVAGLTVGENTFRLQGAGADVSLTLADYYPLGTAPNDDPNTPSVRLDRVPVVFAGYGLTAPSASYDDYAKIDVRDKAVLIFSHEPQEANRSSPLNGTRPMRETTVQAKAEAAQRRGARALIVVGDPSHVRDEANYGLFAADPDAERVGIPVLRVRRARVQRLLARWDLDEVARLIDTDLVPRSRALDGLTFSYVEHLSLNTRTVRNVVGILPGSDPARAGEAIVIGAHYDHVGLGGRFSTVPERTGEIHNGADDNASGTAAVMEIARMAAAERARFPRTLVFVTFAGEERGLLGSQHYADHPAIPIEKTVAMLNLDMVGRSRGAVSVSGLEESKPLDTDFREASRNFRLTVRRSGPGAGRSDDASFLAKGIPAVNFFTGFHDDYHKPSDDWQQVDTEGVANIASLALEFASRIASRP